MKPYFNPIATQGNSNSRRSAPLTFPAALAVELNTASAHSQDRTPSGSLLDTQVGRGAKLLWIAVIAQAHADLSSPSRPVREEASTFLCSPYAQTILDTLGLPITGAAILRAASLQRPIHPPPPPPAPQNSPQSSPQGVGVGEGEGEGKPQGVGACEVPRSPLSSASLNPSPPRCGWED